MDLEGCAPGGMKPNTNSQQKKGNRNRKRKKRPLDEILDL